MDVTATALAALVVGVTAFALLKKGKNHNAAPVDVNGEKVYRSAQHPTSLVEDENGVTTLYESFLQSVKKYGNQNCTGTRKKTGKDTYGKYEWKTYSQVQKLAEQFASAIMAIGAKSGDRIGIFSKNREEWLIAQQGCFSQSLVIVSFYETLGKDSIRYVAHHADIEIALCNQESLSKLFEVMEGKEGYKGLKHIIVLDEYEDDKSSFAKRAKDVGVSLHLFSDFINQGNSKPVKSNPPKPSDLCTIMYTSGTTGTPKGVLLTHKNLAAELGAIFKAIDIPKTPRYLSYLPLAHIFERVIILACLHAGGHIGFFHGDIQAIPDDVKELKPAVFVGVPKIYERTKDAVEKKVSGSPLPARLAFSVAFNIKKFAILYAPWMPVGFLDTLVFNKVKAALGGAVELMISAGAPLSNQSELFLRICFGVPVSQAYGLTETCGASCVKMPTDSTVGHLGGPIPCNEYKLVDLKDMGYTTNDKPNPRGELLIRGHNVTQGYFKDEEKTNEALNNDGWFLTGDIAEYNTKTGSFTVIDRKKNLFKLSQGEYVAVEQVEDKLTKQIDSIEQICVYGDSQQSTLVAIVVKKGGSKGGQDGGSKEDREDMKKQLADAGKKAGLQGFEIPRNVWFAKEPFTAENDLMTPTMKLKRNTIKDTYKKAIEQMYKEGTGR